MFIINHKKIFIGISVILVLLSLAAIFSFGLKPSIEFKGGTLTEIEYKDGRPEISILQEKINSLDLGGVLIQPTGEIGFLIKTKELSEVERLKLFESFSIDGKYAPEEKSFTSIGPSVGRELRQKSLISIILVILAIIFFVAYTFRKVSKPVSSWKYGLIAILALIHDVAIPTGIFAILGKYAGAEVDMLFVVGILTVLGLSVNDTIVVFDRIRENLMHHHKGSSFSALVGKSIKQTFARSINTSFTVILALLALYFLGPVSTKYFALTLIAGMFFGTYSSIFLASPLLAFFEERQNKKK